MHKFAIALALTVAVTGSAFAAETINSSTTTTRTTTTQTTIAAPLVRVNVAPNATFTATIAKAVFSEFNHEGDRVVAILDHALMGPDGRIVAPAGSRLIGELTEVTSYNRDHDTAELGLQFNEVATPAGEHFALDAVAASTDGLLRAGALQGIVIHPDRSIAALEGEFRAESGALAGTKQGKAYVLQEPMVTLGGENVVNATDGSSEHEVLLGVGDRIQLRVGSISNVETNSTNLNSNHDMDQ